MLIGLSGKAGSGKDTVAGILYRLYGLHTLHFADPLKTAARVIFGFTSPQLYDPVHKESVDSYWGFSPRKALQLLGTEGCRSVFGGDVWVRSLMKKLISLPQIIPGVAVADVRFIEEFEALKSCGGFMVRIHRPFSTTLCTNHASEIDLDNRNLDWDFEILNSGTLEDLELQSIRLYESAPKQHFTEGVRKYVQSITEAQSSCSGETIVHGSG